MNSITIAGKPYFIRFEYMEIRNLESFYPGRSFNSILEVTMSDPRLEDVENLIWATIQNPDFSRKELTQKLSDEFMREDGMTIDEIVDSILNAVDQSVFLSRMEKQKEKLEQKAELKKAGAI